VLSPCPVLVRSSDGRHASGALSATYLMHERRKTAGQRLFLPPEKRKVGGSIPPLATISTSMFQLVKGILRSSFAVLSVAWLTVGDRQYPSHSARRVHEHLCLGRFRANC
jgi:hypothetical protein